MFGDEQVSLTGFARAYRAPIHQTGHRHREFKLLGHNNAGFHGAFVAKRLVKHSKLGQEALI
jgi:hypothetical protein